jgi:FtsZ-binding cell division protein ZapB
MSEKYLKLKIEELTKDNARLAKRVKLLTKRIEKLKDENVNLCEEIDAIDAINEKVGIKYEERAEGCPKCNSSVTKLTLPDGKKQVVCDNVDGCNYRRRE